MHLGLFTDCLGGYSTDEMLEICQKLGISAVELGCGAWSAAPHIDVEGLMESGEKRSGYKAKLDSYGVSIAALNCSGNPLDPGPQGKKHADDLIRAFQLAEKLDIHRIVAMSGLPAGCSTDLTPTWIITSWPPETADILKYQWEKTIDFWASVLPAAKDCGIEKIALEPHGWQLVYNVENLRHLRDALGEDGKMIGMNIDPSHPFWMGADPIEMVRDLGELIYHCHIKDVSVRTPKAAVNTMLDPKDVHKIADRSWNFVVPGAGHDERWWNQFVRELLLAGYDDVLSFEMEDYIGDPVDRLAYGVRVLENIIRTA